MVIVKSKNIKNNLLDVVINNFDINFNHLNTIQSNKVDINNQNWIVYNPTITKENLSEKLTDKIILKQILTKKNK